MPNYSHDYLFYELETLRKENKELKCCGNCTMWLSSYPDPYSCGIDEKFTPPDHVCQAWEKKKK